VTDVIVVTRPDATAAVARHLRAGGKAVSVVAGGSTRQASVARGFAHVPPAAEYVIVHDAARPLVTPDLIERTLDAAIESGAAIAAVPASDTVKAIVTRNGEPFVERTIPRERVYLAQTPQAFRRDILADAVARGASVTLATDEAGLVEQAGHAVRLVEGEASNLKITTAHDLALASALLDDGSHAAWRTGTGYDLHRLVAGRPLIIAA
jgi:2-C-methyl-D-erythritol 4-phosphate cytidylyltransferase / 2-C-methyl-D-erythritol 2,4-cyclodiphosphate synthase